ncbi:MULTISPECIES: Hsp70 family protein [unclassified Coleofasciculus]|uniref:Hsp70 family protein n=1 Tax=unclassified Coleofasciculus TaxID=2692782 RepID=UPI0018800841|nr:MULTISPECIES: Hsp70 family protein [unclassified Coleofasciculus]MBE9126841.1 Hsp70 family protein [Coleofasciculus sp. LEGE 07081]MBE9148949.1 Hsp70 family protein [Coleofasciculus sp. LEGE 07092]
MTTVAIDFGTSNTVVCIQDAVTQTPRTLKFEGISRSFETARGKVDVVPSLVLVQAANHLIVGEPVRSLRHNIDESSLLFQGFKRDIAADYRPPTRQIDGNIYSSESISEIFIGQLWQHILSQEIQPTRVIFTVPVGAFDCYRNWVQALAQRLNLPTIQIVDESTAAAFGYAVNQPQSVVLVVDFGGGTLDLSLVRTVAANRGQKVLCSEVVAKSEAYLGGVDIDTWMVEHYLQKIGISRTNLTQNIWQNLLDVAERLKIQLSTATEVTETYFDPNSTTSHDWHLTRSELEDIFTSRQLLTQVQEALDEVLAIALTKGISQEEIDKVVLVGGSCQIPAVQQLMISYFGQERLSLDKPLEAVAHGALTVGKIVGVEDYLQHSYAIRLWDLKAKTYSYFSVFDKGTRYPTQRPRLITLQAATNEQHQMRLDIGELTEAVSVEVAYNDQGQLTSKQIPQPTEFRVLADQAQHVYALPFTPPGKTGVDRLQLSLMVNEHRVLVLTVKDLLTQRVLLNQIELRGNANQPRLQESGSNRLEPVDGAVLGGLAGARRRLEVAVAEQPIAPPSEASASTSSEAESPVVQPKVNWCLLDCRYQLTGHTSGVTSLAISPDGQTLASGSQDATIRLWQLSTGKLERWITGHNHAVSNLAMSPDGKILASSSQDNTVKLWHLRSGEWLRTVTGHTAPVFAVAFSPDGRTLASGGWEGTILLQQIYQKALPRQFSGHPGGVSAIAFSPDGQTLVSCGDKTIKMWHLHTGELLQTLVGHSDLVVTMAISPNGRLLASGGGMTDKTIKLWDLEMGELICTLSEQAGDVLSLAFSPDGHTLASGSYRRIYLWDLDEGELLHTLSGHSGDVLSVIFSCDRQTVISGSADGTIRVWGLV